MSATADRTQDSFLRERRERLGISRRQIAKNLGVSPRQLGEWEIGNVPMTNYSTKFVNYVNALDQLEREKHVYDLTNALNAAIEEVAQYPQTIENQWFRMTLENALEQVPMLAATNVDLMNESEN